MNTKKQSSTVRQECAAYIIENPGASMVEIQNSTKRFAGLPGNKRVCRTLLDMVANNEVIRSGGRKAYRYHPGPNLDYALSSKRAPRKAGPKRHNYGDDGPDDAILGATQVWLSQGDYVIDTRNMHARSIFDWAAR